MDVLNVGPLALPVRALVPVLGILASVLVAEWFARYRRVDAWPVLWKVILAGLVAARAAFVARHLDVYAAAPLEVLDIRDGGFAATAGLFVAFIAAAELTRRAAPMRKPVLTAALVGGAVWIGAAIATLDFSPARTPVPAVEVRRLDGSPATLRSAGGKPMVVNLWATWCPPCRREMPVLRDAQVRNPDIEFVFVNQGEDAATVARYLAREALTLANVFTDAAGMVGKRTEAAGFPTTLFYDRNGLLLMRQVGGVSAASLQERLEALRAAR